MLGQVPSAVDKVVTECAEHVGTIVRRVTALTETEVLSASNNVISINSEAKQHVEDLSHLVGRVQEDASTVAAVMREQESFVKDMMRRLHEQDVTANESIELTKSILAFGRNISAISVAARMLTINAHIESARLGAGGRAFAVIADQLRDLSVQVQAANTAISDLAAKLIEIMPRVGEHSHAMLEMTSDFSGRQLVRFRDAYERAQGMLHAALSESQEGARRILRGANEILSHLQFQDRATQDMNELDQRVHHASSVLAAMLMLIANGEFQEENAMDALAQAQQSLPFQGRLGGDQTGAPDVDAGEVQLF